MQWLRSVSRWIPFASLLAVIASALYFQFSFHSPAKAPEYPIQRTVKYSFTVKNPNSYPVQAAELAVYAPLSQSAFQRLTELTTTHPYRLMEDDKGNDRMTFVLENLPPYASQTITITASINLSERGNQIDRILSEEFLGDEELIGLKNAGTQRIAARLQSDSPRETAKRIYNWITNNIKKSGYTQHDIGAPQALKNKSGDCTEFMYIFSAMARASGIPTRNMAGFVASENKILRPADYHNWNEVFIDGDWYLIDTDKQVFMEKSADYIAMRLIGGVTRNNSINSQSFFTSSKEIQVTMN